MWLRPQWGASC
ncbi:hypothetical protein EYF80_066538 [Liparis tanakae]|uniref:Uncharacterized protein n=1 Tax=Liparis tanakae TaxID=230148 RepID=A0A4Z2E3R7_9TELE|nr:hypothetical protein EYF80_066538 [Liparis tanakae]